MLELPNATKINGTTIRWGKEGAGPPLVMIHGTPFSSQVWRNIVPHIKDKWTVYFYDLAGYGQSEMHAGQDVSLGVQNQVLAALLKEWGLDRPHVLAHDFGGATALRGYFLNGLRYSSLTIFDAVALAPWGSPLVQHLKQHEAAFSGMPGYMHEAILRAYLQTAAHRPLSDQALNIYTAPWIGEIGQPAFYRQIAQMDQAFTDEAEVLYQKMDCQVRVFWGEKDNWIPIQKGHELADKIAGTPCEAVANSGHLLQEDCPEAIVSMMLK
ncbi:MAG: alpha/beta hydrolase [Paracoccaceae bacterium]